MHSFEVADKAIGQKVFDTEKRIISGVENLDTMRFIVGRFTSFSSEIELLPRIFQLIKA
ncbi:hypothetical protein [Streptococcus pseudopneumoniae]|uniref:hypothetical protein n=1 Tax=Streptococcus pseudopneumoniae TaxID=257758 RepID=UPI00021B01DA|nr:hypothetical protein [Streptococcus pseudopneumoniae]AEL10586.1 hypothetical protein SPPN_05750 [Streptococcus pseudopneumoniae IS7493]